MTNSDKAAVLFSQGHNCAQSVAMACGPAQGLSRETACAVAQAFGGGMSRCGQACGAVTGALMVIGARHHRTEADVSGKERASRLTRDFIGRFARQHGSINCTELVGMDLAKPAGFERFHKEGIRARACLELVRWAAALVDELLSREQDRKDGA